MTTNGLDRLSLLALPLVAAVLAPGLAAQISQLKRSAYFPAAGTGKHKVPAEAGMDAAKLRQAVEWAEAHGSKWDFDKDRCDASSSRSRVESRNDRLLARCR